MPSSPEVKKQALLDHIAAGPLPEELKLQALTEARKLKMGDDGKWIHPKRQAVTRGKRLS